MMVVGMVFAKTRLTEHVFVLKHLLNRKYLAEAGENKIMNPT